MGEPHRAAVRLEHAGGERLLQLLASESLRRGGCSSDGAPAVATRPSNVSVGPAGRSGAAPETPPSRQESAAAAALASSTSAGSAPAISSVVDRVARGRVADAQQRRAGDGPGEARLQQGLYRAKGLSGPSGHPNDTLGWQIVFERPCLPAVTVPVGDDTPYVETRTHPTKLEPQGRRRRVDRATARRRPLGEAASKAAANSSASRTATPIAVVHLTPSTSSEQQRSLEGVAAWCAERCRILHYYGLQQITEPGEGQLLLRDSSAGRPASGGRAARPRQALRTTMSLADPRRPLEHQRPRTIGVRRRPRRGTRAAPGAHPPYLISLSTTAKRSYTPPTTCGPNRRAWLVVRPRPLTARTVRTCNRQVAEGGVDVIDGACARPGVRTAARASATARRRAASRSELQRTELQIKHRPV